MPGLVDFSMSRKDIRNPVFYRDIASEMLAVTILMVVITLVLISNDPRMYPVTTTHIGIFAAFLVYLLIEGYGPFSGAHLNPIASFSLWIAGKITFVRAIAYMVVQVLGSAAGSGIGYILTPANKTGGDQPAFHAFNPTNSGLTNYQGVAIEAIFAFNLIFVALSSFDTQNRPSPAVLPALTIGFAIAIGVMAAGTHTGGLMNPIVALGPALLSQDFTNHWVYWLGPFIGGPLAVGVYKLLVFVKDKYEPKDPGEAGELKNSAVSAAKELHRLVDELQKQIKAIDGAAV